MAPSSVIALSVVGSTLIAIDSHRLAGTKPAFNNYQARTLRHVKFQPTKKKETLRSPFND